MIRLRAAGRRQLYGQMVAVWQGLKPLPPPAAKEASTHEGAGPSSSPRVTDRQLMASFYRQCPKAALWSADEIRSMVSRDPPTSFTLFCGSQVHFGPCGFLRLSRASVDAPWGFRFDLVDDARVLPSSSGDADGALHRNVEGVASIGVVAVHLQDFAPMDDFAGHFEPLESPCGALATLVRAAYGSDTDAGDDHRDHASAPHAHQVAHHPGKAAAAPDAAPVDDRSTRLQRLDDVVQRATMLEWSLVPTTVANRRWQRWRQSPMPVMGTERSEKDTSVIRAIQRLKHDDDQNRPMVRVVVEWPAVRRLGEPTAAAARRSPDDCFVSGAGRHCYFTALTASDRLLLQQLCGMHVRGLQIVQCPTLRQRFGAKRCRRPSREDLLAAWRTTEGNNQKKSVAGGRKKRLVLHCRPTLRAPPKGCD